jgi:hypothetical protein
MAYNVDGRIAPKPLKKKFFTKTILWSMKSKNVVFV